VGQGPQRVDGVAEGVNDSHKSALIDGRELDIAEQQKNRDDPRGETRAGVPIKGPSAAEVFTTGQRELHVVQPVQRGAGQRVAVEPLSAGTVVPASEPLDSAVVTFVAVEAPALVQRVGDTDEAATKKDNMQCAGLEPEPVHDCDAIVIRFTGTQMGTDG
jgi:hypothetical protein